MKRAILVLLVATALLTGCKGKQSEPQSENRAERIAALINDPQSKQVLVISHRGDWRNFPENSVAAVESVIRMGVDIVEIDLKMTSDSVLIIMHDQKIDRTTTGKGLVSDITYDSVSRCNLKAGHGVKTDHKVPTLEDILKVCKDRIVINIDQGYQYYDQVMALLDKYDMADQVLIKGKKSPAEVAAKFAQYDHNMMYMPIIDINKPAGQELFELYKTEPAPLAYELCWDTMTPEVRECMRAIKQGGSKLWVNSLWASLCGGLDDDKAYFEPEVIYGQIVDLGATMIQTDRPELLIDYLKSVGLHD